MATTRIISMHINKGKTIAQCLKARVEEHILCHKGAYMGKNGITRDRTGKLWYYRNLKR